MYSYFKSSITMVSFLCYIIFFICSCSSNTDITNADNIDPSESPIVENKGTTVSISGENFLIDGKLTFEGRN